MNYILTIMLVAALGLLGLGLLYPNEVRRYVPAEIAETIGLGADDADEADGQSQGGGRRVPVTAAAVQVGTALDKFASTGSVSPAEHVQVAAEIAGRVAEVLVDDGEVVQAGAPIVRLDDVEARVALRSARAQLEEAASEYRRQKELAEKKYAAEAQLETARAAQAKAQAEVDQAEERLAKHTIRAPFDASAGFIEVSPGAYLTPGAPVAELATTDRLRATFFVPTRFARTIKKGSQVTVREVGAELSVETSVKTVSPLTEENTRSVQVEAALSGDDVPFRVGDFVEVDVVTERRSSAKFVPETAVLRRGPDSYVYVIKEDETLATTAVRTGARAGDLIEIVSDEIRASDRVVSSGLQKVSDGVSVKVTGRHRSRAPGGEPSQPSGGQPSGGQPTGGSPAGSSATGDVGTEGATRGPDTTFVRNRR